MKIWSQTLRRGLSACKLTRRVRRGSYRTQLSARRHCRPLGPQHHPAVVCMGFVGIVLAGASSLFDGTWACPFKLVQVSDPFNNNNNNRGHSVANPLPKIATHTCNQSTTRDLTTALKIIGNSCSARRMQLYGNSPCVSASSSLVLAWASFWRHVSAHDQASYLTCGAHGAAGESV